MNLDVQLLAKDTTEAVAIWRVGRVVYKILRPAAWFGTACCTPSSLRRAPADVVAGLTLRMRESWRWPELNPQLYLPDIDVVVSRFVPGRHASRAEAFELVRHFQCTDRNYLRDVEPSNIRVDAAGKKTLVDFLIDTRDGAFPNT